MEKSGKIDTDAECYAGVCREKNGYRLISREIIFDEFQRISSQGMIVLDRDSHILSAAKM